MEFFAMALLSHFANMSIEAELAIGHFSYDDSATNVQWSESDCQMHFSNEEKIR